MALQRNMATSFYLLILFIGLLQLTLVYHHSIAVTGHDRYGDFQTDKVHNLTRVQAVNTTIQQRFPLGQSGYEFAANVSNICRVDRHFQKLGANVAPSRLTNNKVIQHILGAPTKQLLYCPIEKIGTTFWRRVLHVLNLPGKKANYSNPYDVPILDALKSSKLQSISVNSLSKGFSFFFVRDPYSRLLSAFVDKLVSPNPIYWNTFGVPAIALARPKKGAAVRPLDGHDVTFAEFVYFVTNREKSGVHLDSHFYSVTRGCSPCSANFKYIGRMETFKQDTVTLLKKLKLDSFVDSLDKDFEEQTLDDAIVDSITGPFEWKNDTIKIISWDKALQRIWLKLQMRGIIASRFPIQLSNIQVGNISKKEFIQMARKAHRESSAEELKKQKAVVKREAFSTVPTEYMTAFREAFQRDFYLFKYDDTPSYVFQHGIYDSSQLLFFNYTHLN